MNSKRDIDIYHEEIENLKGRPTLFLHTCCGPCLCYPISELSAYFSLTIGFFNPNIYPEEEYEKRFAEVKKVVFFFNEKNNADVKIVKNDEDFLFYQKNFQGRKDDVEGGEYCRRCHYYRMNISYKYAYEHHFDYFTTVMTVSSKKPSSLLNDIGRELEKKYSCTKFLIADFKKEDGQLKGIKIAKELGLYRQNYCGCIHSLKERNQR